MAEGTCDSGFGEPGTRDAGADVLELDIEFAEQDESMHGPVREAEACTSTYNCDPDSGWCEHTASPS
jgi:hypothetical protein